MVTGGLAEGSAATPAVLRICEGYTTSGQGRKAPVYASGAVIGVQAVDLSIGGVADVVGQQKVFYLTGNLSALSRGIGKGDNLVILDGGAEVWAITSILSVNVSSMTVLMTLRGSGPVISFPSTSVVDNATIGTVIETATINGIYVGTISWSLLDSAGGQFAIDAVTGQLRINGALSDGPQPITISAGSGTTPIIPSNTFVIAVTPAFLGTVVGADDGVILGADTGVMAGAS